jgi:hypothetical protein
MTRTTCRMILQFLFALCLAAPMISRAQDVPAPHNKLELGLNLGYSQGLGPIGKGRSRLQDLGKAGGAFQLDVGWRLDPHWMVGGYGELGVFGAGNEAGSNHAVSAAAGLQTQYHVLPQNKLDPWVGLGFGWRGYWADQSRGTYGVQGLDLVRFKMGLDYRVSSSLALGPVIGVTMTEFLSDKAIGADKYRDIDDRKLNTFVFAGVGGRFDLL